MNVQSLELAATYLDIVERAYVQLRELFERERSGNPYTPAELQALKTDSDAAHAVIQGWNPPPA